MAERTARELAAAARLVVAMRARRLSLSTWGVGFALALYEAGADAAAEKFLDGMVAHRREPAREGED